MRLPELDDVEPPPFFSTWKNVYAAVLLWLAFLIALFYGFTLYFA